ncbi:MAG TPA: fasciclin domain-containing protein [Chitinophagaceae bacterium]|nr:fasciclin domain-containing protein [Chitinophagaceae bacterium]
MKNLTFSVAIIATASILLFSCKKNSSSSNAALNTIKSDPSLSIFTAIENRAGDDALFTDGYAYVIPTDSAFISFGLSSAAVSSLGQATCDSIVRYYMLPNGFSFSNTAGTELGFGTNLSNTTLYADSTQTALYFNGVSATSLTPVVSGNSVIYKLNGMLNVPLASVTQITAADPDLSLFNEAIIRTNLIANFTGNAFTLLAPTNEAFNAAGYPDVASIDAADINSLTQLLLYHTISNRLFTNDMMQLTSIPTLQSGAITVTTSGGSLQLVGTSDPGSPASILDQAQLANNVVLYKINHVLTP